ncbi:MAG: cobyrinate a,c-diamide synthase [Parasporobacterium sp.]|nr:cobyrinate a,c-diamide synthase [Parasporobacterium sp.]
MKSNIPRIMLAGTGSGCGKTTITCAILKAFKDRGFRAASFKCGPDYIDPMFHRSITGRNCSSLDSFFFDADMLNYLLVKNAADSDIAVIEGVMGYYDGISIRSEYGSSCDIARKTGTPVILCVDGKGTALSLLAVIYGFLNFAPENNIRGVIINRCSQMTYRMLSEAVLDRFEGRIKPLGYMPVMKNCSLESRHLGLVTAGEIDDLKEKTDELARQAEGSLDLEGITELASQAAEVADCGKQAKEPVKISGNSGTDRVRIAVARDKAFCFYYEDSLELLKEMGAELVEFSPLEDTELPADIQGLYLGGGYPELYAKQLSGNRSMIQSVRRVLAVPDTLTGDAAGVMSDSGMSFIPLPCIAECGGFMYLTESIAGYPMTGLLKGGCFDTGKLCRFGYITLTAERDNMLCTKGESIRAHEFHHWDADDPGSNMTAVKMNGRQWQAAYADEYMYAGFPHFHFYANPEFAENFIAACRKYKNAQSNTDPVPQMP